MNILTKRVATVIDIGNSKGLTLSQELADIGVAVDTQVNVTVTDDGGRKRIIIEKKA